MKVAAIQHAIEWENGDVTRKHLLPLIGQAAATGARLIAVTEMYATGFSMDPERIAEEEGGPNEQFLIDQAREHQAWLVGSLAQFGQDGKARNVAVLAGPEGQLYRYAKIHPFSYSGEHHKYAAGTEFLTVRIEGLRVSVFICYDLRFADQFTALGRLGAELIVVPASWGAGPGKEEQWDLLTRARAADAQSWLLACDQAYVPPVGTDPLGIGRSSLTSPLGQTHTRLAAGPDILHATVDTELVATTRARVPIL